MNRNLFFDYFDTIDELLQSSGKIVILFDSRKFKIKYVNNLFCDFYHVSKESVMDKEIFSYIPYTRDELIDIIVSTINNNIYQNHLINIKDKVARVEIKKISTPSTSDDIFGCFAEIVTTAESENVQLKSILSQEVTMINAFALSYKKIYFMNINTGDYFKLNTSRINSFDYNFEGKYDFKNFNKLVTFADDEYKEKLAKFFDKATLKDRLRGKNRITEEYKSKIDGWCRIGLAVCGRDAFGDAETLLFTFRLINDLKSKELTMQNAVIDALNNTKNASDIKSEFLSRIGNDIITPLNSIVGMASLAKSNTDDKNKLENSLQRILDSSQQLIRTFSEVLDMSKIEAGNVTFVREEIDLGDLFTNLVNAHRKDILERKHRITVKNSQVKHEFIFGDRTRIQQIFNNILDNAIRYTQDRGNIEISIVEKNEDENKKIAEYEITFTDNGLGMSEEFIKKAVEPFEREDRPQVKAYDGAGLGLSIANSYIQKMGGKLKIKSDLALGTKVIVTLFAEVINKNYPKYKDCENTKLLLISNNTSQVTDVVATLSSMNIEAVVASSARMAINLLKESQNNNVPFTYIWCTWMTTSMFGTSVIEEIRKSVDFELPKIVFAHYDLERIAEEAQVVGVNDFVALPLFKNRIHTLLNKLSGQDQESSQEFKLRKNKVLKGKKVLIVEDNELNREILNDFLQMHSIDIYEARNGKEALDMFMKSEEYFYDLILMDIQMPVMNGYESTMSIRGLEREDGKRIPIIAMSASAFAEDINASLIAGMNEHVAKPLNYESLYNSIEKWFNGDYAIRKLLEVKAETDPFTNVLNKVATFDRIHKYLYQDDVSLSALIIFDLDNFKNINDIYGHKEGDMVIRETAELTREFFRENDIIGRFGGDEFIIFMKDIENEKIAIKRANDLREKVIKQFDNRYDDLQLTASMGIAFVDKAMNEEELFVAADQALYRAKKNGKNQVESIRIR